ncbi:ribonuclease H-like domain-containing protein [Tanacetum coccineum]
MVLTMMKLLVLFVKMVTVRCLISIIVVNSWSLYQLDVNNALLHGDLVKDFYMTLPQGYDNVDKTKVCKLNKSLYGDSKPQGSGMLNSILLWPSMALNDIVITSNDEYGIKEFKEFLSTKFLIKDFGVLKYFIGIEILENENGFYMSQRKYCLELLYEYGLLAARPVDIPLPEKCVLSFEEYKKDKYHNDFTSYQKLMGKESPGYGIQFNKSFDLKLRDFVDAD